MEFKITNVNLEDAAHAEPKDMKLGPKSTKTRLSVVYKAKHSDTAADNEDVYILVYQGKKSFLSGTVDNGSAAYSKYTGNASDSPHQGYVQYKTATVAESADGNYKSRTMYYGSNLAGESVETRGARQYVEQCELDLAEVEVKTSGDNHDGLIKYTIIVSGKKTSKIYDGKYITIARDAVDPSDKVPAANVNGLSIVSFEEHYQKDEIASNNAPNMGKGSWRLSNRALAVQDLEEKLELMRSINVELVELIKSKLL